MSIKLVPAIVLGLLLGFGLGCIPELNEHLHWNIWFIIPISGLIVGGLMGWLQFWVCYFINQKVGGWSFLILSLSAMIGYAAVDYGIYFSMTIPISGVEGISDGDYRFSDVTTFSEYMKWRLGSSSFSTRHGIKFDMGTIGTSISYIVDLGGALLGAVGILFFCADKYPYCDRCFRFKKREKKYKILFKFDENLANEIFIKIAELIDRGGYKDMISYIRNLSEMYHEKGGDAKIVVDQRFCPTCREASIIGNVFLLGKRELFGNREWKEVDELSLSFTSQPGEHISLNV